MRELGCGLKHCILISRLPAHETAVAKSSWSLWVVAFSLRPVPSSKPWWVDQTKSLQVKQDEVQERPLFKCVEPFTCRLRQNVLPQLSFSQYRAYYWQCFPPCTLWDAVHAMVLWERDVFFSIKCKSNGPLSLTRLIPSVLCALWTFTSNLKTTPYSSACVDCSEVIVEPCLLLPDVRAFCWFDRLRETIAYSATLSFRWKET